LLLFRKRSSRASAGRPLDGGRRRKKTVNQVEIDRARLLKILQVSTREIGVGRKRRAGRFCNDFRQIWLICRTVRFVT
jgi:hypothetical protein